MFVYYRNTTFTISTIVTKNRVKTDSKCIEFVFEELKIFYLVSFRMPFQVKNIPLWETPL